MSGVLLALATAAAGGLGSVLRQLVDSAFPSRLRERFPWGIMVINLSGSLLLGTLTGVALESALLTVLGTGLLGGYTTFSTASLDTVRLLRERRYRAALWNGLGMLLLSIVLAVSGMLLGAAISGAVR